MLRRSRPWIMAGTLAAVLSCSTGCYLTHVCLGQLDVACSSVDVEEALADPALTPEAKERIRFIAEIKTFAVEKLGMEPSDNYTTYYPGEPDQPLTWVVVAAERLKLKSVTHWFPIVGSVSYQGYFDRESAQARAAELEADGYDVIVRPAAAYSTLGWFTDPITPLMLRHGEPELAELILHELTHGEIYASGQTDFNESLASFVGLTGALQMAEARWGADSPQARRLREGAVDEARFDVFLRDLKGRLEALYGDAARPGPEKLAERARIFEDAAGRLKAMAPEFRVRDYGGIAGRPMNNAVVMANLTYQDVKPFESLFARVRGSWPDFFAAARRAAEAGDPARALLQENSPP